MKSKMLALMTTVTIFVVNPAFAMEIDRDVKTIIASKVPSEELFQQVSSLRQKLKTLKNNFEEQKKERNSKEFHAKQGLLIDKEKRLRGQLDAQRIEEHMLPPSIFSDTAENRLWKIIDGSRGSKELLELEDQYSKIVLDLRKTSPGYLPSKMCFTEIKMHHTRLNALKEELNKLKSSDNQYSSIEIEEDELLIKACIEKQQEKLKAAATNWKDMWTNRTETYNFSYSSQYFGTQIRGWELSPISIR